MHPLRYRAACSQSLSHTRAAVSCLPSQTAPSIFSHRHAVPSVPFGPHRCLVCHLGQPDGKIRRHGILAISKPSVKSRETSITRSASLSSLRNRRSASVAPIKKAAISTFDESRMVSTSLPNIETVPGSTIAAMISSSRTFASATSVFSFSSMKRHTPL